MIRCGLLKFCAWLKIPLGRVGVGREKVAVDDREAKAPVKAAVMYKQNIGRKVGEWLREIRFLLDKEVWGPVREARVDSLLLSLRKAPWEPWCGLVIVPVPDDSFWESALQRSRYWVEWADAHWDRIHLEVITYDMDVSEVDVQVMPAFRNPGPAEQTVLANGLNSKSRTSRHFGVAVSSRCEHGCDDQDDMFHRVYKCRATAILRERHSIGPAVVTLVEASCSKVLHLGGSSCCSGLSD